MLLARGGFSINVVLRYRKSIDQMVLSGISTMHKVQFSGLKALAVSLVVVLLPSAMVGCSTWNKGRMASPVAATPLQRLMRGNQRFVQGKLTFADASPARRAELLKGQQPLAVIVACSDSRVPPTLVFDQGLGRLFVVRLAGDVVDKAAAGSVEYAVEHLHVHLVVVLGHDDCGAVKAALHPGADQHSPELGAVIHAIHPAVESAKAMPGDLLHNAIDANTRLQARRLRALPVLAKLIKAGKLEILAARYELDTGRVVLLK